jgi:hypothetical protein
MSRHEPDEYGRCRATDLLSEDCAGCRGSDTTFVDALLASEPDPDPDYGEPDTEPDRDEELAARALRPVPRDKFWLRTGEADPGKVVRTGRPFKSMYSGTKCPLCPKIIRANQRIVNTSAGYAHARCLEDQ